ncbi:MAG: UDP-glucose 4-epimerase GalE [Crocinitomicaceae bacterium]
MEDKKHILVTGGAGFIGSHTVVALFEKGFVPIIVDDLRNAQASVLNQLKEITGQTPIHFPVDCCDKKALKKVFEQFPIAGIIHFAAYKAVGESVSKPLEYYQNNLLSLINILQLAEEFSVRNIVFSSSCTVYGEPENNIVVDESFPIQAANSPYGTTKIFGEKILTDYQAASPHAKVICLRYFNPIGAHKSALIGELPIGKPNNLVPYITQTASGKLEKLTVFGADYPTPDGSCIRDYIHVEDLADAHVHALIYSLEQENSFIEAINIGTGTGTTVLELIHLFEKVTGVKLNYTVGPRREGDITAIYANNEKAKKILQWKPKRTLEESMLSAWRWEQNNTK